MLSKKLAENITSKTTPLQNIFSIILAELIF